MAKDSGHPNFPKGGKQVYKYDKGLDQSVKSQQQYPMFNMDGTPAVMPGNFAARRDAQIKNRKKQGM